MYRPKWVLPADDRAHWHLIERFPFAAVVSRGAARMLATHVPLFRADDTTLLGHMARANSQWRELDRDPQLLAIFQSPSSYISPRIYVDEPDVPTWNYSAVHVHGRYVKADAARTSEILERTVRHFSADGWSLAEVDAALVADFTTQVVAFTIEIESIEVAQKLSQDKTAADHARVRQALERSDDPAARTLGELMAHTRSAR